MVTLTVDTWSCDVVRSYDGWVSGDLFSVTEETWFLYVVCQKITFAWHLWSCRASWKKEAMRGEAEIKLWPSCLSKIRHNVKKRGSSIFSLHVCVSVISVCHPPGMGGWEDGRMEREAAKGCKLIRFLSLHAPLPVLLLSNPGGQRCAAQRLDS